MDQRNGSGYRGHVVPSLVAKGNLILWKVDPTWLLSLNDQTFYTCDISKTKGEEKHTARGSRVRVGAPTRRVDYRTSKLFACQHESLKILSKGQGITI